MTCPEANPTVERVLSYYGDKIYYTAHTYPLWLHRQAYTVAQVRRPMQAHYSNSFNSLCCRRPRSSPRMLLRVRTERQKHLYDRVQPIWFLFTDYWKFHEFVFANQDQFSNAAFFNKTASDLYHVPVFFLFKNQRWFSASFSGIRFLQAGCRPSAYRSKFSTRRSMGMRTAFNPFFFRILIDAFYVKQCDPRCSQRRNAPWHYPSSLSNSYFHY